MISFGGYHLCVFDLITDHKTGRLSSGQIWFHIANLIESYRILFNGHVEWIEVLIYLAVVGGSNVAMQAVKWRFRDVQPDSRSKAGRAETDSGDN